MDFIIVNGLPELAWRRKISGTAFAKLMTKAGFRLSPAHAYRYLSDTPPAMTLEFVAVACAVFECASADIFKMTPKPFHANSSTNDAKGAGASAQSKVIEFRRPGEGKGEGSFEW